MKIRLKRNTVIAGQYAAMGSEAEVPEKIARDLKYRGHAEILETEEPKKTKE